jgi:starch synthase
MKLELLTKEYPPFIYGGAGVHVDELSRVLAKYIDVHVRAIGEEFEVPKGVNLQVNGYAEDAVFENAALQTMGADLQIANAVKDADIVHSHTWYVNFAGMLASLKNHIPHVISAHSLEPLRPWKAEQLGGGYEISKFIEKNAYEQAAGIIAVSGAMRDDILRCYDLDPEKVKVIHNGIDLNRFKMPVTEAEKAEAREIAVSYGINASLKTAVFVGRITRQKGFVYLIEALKKVPKDVQIVLCAGAPDTKEIAREVADGFAKLEAERGNVIWIEKKLPQNELTAILANSDVFLCPSIYEPLGIVNLEAMALKLPVVATKTGGIPEVVMDGETGYLVDIEQLTDGSGTPLDPEKYANDFADAINRMFSDLERAKKMGEAGYERAKTHFSWETIGIKTIDFYKDVIREYDKR